MTKKPIGAPPMTLERLRKKYSADPRTGCWIWAGRLDPDGYATATWRRKTWRAHRLLWTIAYGEIPRGLVIDHLCRVRHCVNPAHLEPVTSGENSRRGLTGKLPTNSLARANSLKTSCKHGHPFDAKNTIWRRRADGRMSRQCRACTYAIIERSRERRDVASRDHGGSSVRGGDRK